MKIPPVLSDKDLAATRLMICEACPHYNKPKCMQCGCYMPVKVQLRFAKCPIHKWE